MTSLVHRAFADTDGRIRSGWKVLGFVFLYCDGRTPLLTRWPFPGGRVSIATYNDDFLLLRQLQEGVTPAGT